MAKYRARIAGAKPKDGKTNEDYSNRKLIAQKHSYDRQFNMMVVDGNLAEYKNLLTLPVVDYLEKVNKFTMELELRIREIEKLKSKRRGR